MKNKVKLIALDMDGTLTSEDHLTVSEENRAALKRASENGAKIAIATGRTRSILGDVCQQVPEIDYIIHSNGAAVFDRKTNGTIYENPMPWDIAKRLIDYFNNYEIFLEIYESGMSYAQEDKIPYFSEEVLPKEFLDEALKGMTICDDFLETLGGKSIEKITAHIFDKELYGSVWDYLCKSDDLEVTKSFSVGIDITKAGANKGTAMKSLCEKLGITPDECMAFGDESNDIPMITFSKYGFAMENASEACKEAASYITKSNAESGVAHGINQIMFE
ncbi:MAG: HAD family phosphatase [Eubacterium sp.]|nr:HAD family phosphatase [Eubacterium sp.]